MSIFYFAKLFHLIHLSVCKAIHGEFSKEYFLLVQKYREKYPNLTTTVKKCFGTETILRFENLIVRNEKFPVFKTKGTILFEKTAFGSGIQQPADGKVEITCVNYLKIGNNIIKITGYRNRIMNYPALLLFFSEDGIHFMGEYTFTDNHQAVSGHIARTILKRYDCEMASDERQFYIEDELGSVICFCDNGFSLSVKYFNPAYLRVIESIKIMFHRKFADKQITGTPQFPLFPA